MSQSPYLWGSDTNWLQLRYAFGIHIFFISYKQFQIALHLLICLLSRIRKIPNEDIDFTDRSYQTKLPLHARSTASQAVKNNLRITELMADGSIILGQQKVGPSVLYPFLTVLAKKYFQSYCGHMVLYDIDLGNIV